MTDERQDTAPIDTGPPNGGRAPSPTAMVLALALMVLMGANLYFDQLPTDYQGLYLTGICAALIAGVLGFDLKFPGRGDGK